MTGEEVAKELEQRLGAIERARQYGSSEDCMVACATALNSIKAWSPLILSHLRAGSDAAIERAAVAARDAAATRAEGRGFWLGIARAAIRAAVTEP